jgi:hypothetical protein
LPKPKEATGDCDDPYPNGLQGSQYSAHDGDILKGVGVLRAPNEARVALFRIHANAVSLLVANAFKDITVWDSDFETGVLKKR